MTTKQAESRAPQRRRPGGGARLFDLNIEEMLEAWEVSHAIREVISNALDEQFLSGTRDIEIDKKGGLWHVRDFGRGLQIEHFTLNENEEKLGAGKGVIGKFGVGLKDALATFHRRGVEVTIRSRWGTFVTVQSAKHAFEGISTLHISYDDSSPDMEGTEFLLEGVTDDQMSEAKSMFLRFSDEATLETTRYGDILRRRPETARVYISGVLASEEENFLFSYNVTDLTEGLRKRLNRERLNVGRTTYAERVKQMLREATAAKVLDELGDQIRRRSSGALRDELQWIDISLLALTYLHSKKNVLFVTEQELHSHPDVVDHARRDRLEIVIVSGAEKKKLLDQAEAGGPETRTLETYVKEFNASFEYRFVEPDDLRPREKEVFDRTEEILALVDMKGRRVPPVLLSETMRMGRDDTDGVWDPDLEAIVIKRACLRTLRYYAATLLHEAAHASSRTVDATREFESVLTDFLGRTSIKALDS
jgi:hypothetical protein